MSAKSCKTPTCGIVMPISAIDGCSAEHWAEVLGILKETAEKAGFKAELVSESEESGIIHKSIVQNIYSSDVILCDVSCRNPNVMFELGMRLAFDLPTIIVKDDQTSYSFDTSAMEHVPYPRDLRFGQIVAFKEKLCKKLTATLGGTNSKSFLKSFGHFETVKIDSQEVSADKFIVAKLGDMEHAIKRLSQDVARSSRVNDFNADLRPSTKGSLASLHWLADHLTTSDGEVCAKLMERILNTHNEDQLDELQEILMQKRAFEMAQKFIKRRAEKANTVFE